MGRLAVKVCVRTRPTSDFAANEILIDGDRHVRQDVGPLLWWCA
jgi:hypothetical protein